MTGKIKVAVVGYGNLGKMAVEAVQVAPDMELAGVVKRGVSYIKELDGIPALPKPDLLEQVDVALLCIPTRSIPEVAMPLLRKGINTVDSWDIHGEPLVALKRSLNETAVKASSVSMTAAGWDPGADSLIRALFEVMIPKGLTYTNHGPGMSLGHTVAAKSTKGVADAVSITIPMGAGTHRRVVYVRLKEGVSLEQVKADIKADPYFARDELQVIVVDDITGIVDAGHGVVIERKGVSGKTHNQRVSFDARINNPALTSQMMVTAARATARLSPGAYTLLDVPVGYLLPIPVEEQVRRLV